MHPRLQLGTSGRLGGPSTSPVPSGVAVWHRAAPVRSQQIVRVRERGSDGQQHRGARVALRFGIVSYLLCGVLWILVTLALYRLLKGVNQALAVLMVILGSVVVVPIFFVNTVNDAAALLLVRGGGYLPA